MGRYVSYQWGLPVLPSFSDRKFFWEDKAQAIHAKWGRGDWDYDLLTRIVLKYKIRSVLDVGCGSGRLFPLYQCLGIKKMLGVDISRQALEIAGQDFPDVPTQCLSIDTEPLPAGQWDLAISNRVLQHIPSRYIETVVSKLCEVCNIIYINELTETDGVSEDCFMLRHDYGKLFRRNGYRILESGNLGEQRYLLFGQAQPQE